MALFLSLVLLRFVLKDDYFLRLVLRENFAYRLNAFDVLSRLDPVVVRHEQDVEFVLVSNRGVKFLKIYDVAVFDFVLLTFLPPRRNNFRGAFIFRDLLPFPSGTVLL